MIKLENPVSTPQAHTLLSIQSLSELPTISLNVDERIPSKRVGEGFVEMPDQRNQQVTFINQHGEPVSMEGNVGHEEAVQIAGAFKVVLAVRLSNGLKGAYGKGSVSKAYSELEIVKVLEVWSSASKCLWRAPDAQQAGKPAKTLNEAGKVVAAA